MLQALESQVEKNPTPISKNEGKDVSALPASVINLSFPLNIHLISSIFNL